MESRYRDRAKERREGKGVDDGQQDMSTTADYRAVAPELKAWVYTYVIVSQRQLNFYIFTHNCKHVYFIGSALVSPEL